MYVIAAIIFLALGVTVVIFNKLVRHKNLIPEPRSVKKSDFLSVTGASWQAKSWHVAS